MNLLTSGKSWLVAPVVTAVGLLALLATWGALDPAEATRLFDCDGASPVELMTLPLFALMIPLVWLCPPFGGSWKRKVFWNVDVSLLAFMAIVRETDLHKRLFASIWPEVAASFKGTVFKMKFLTAADIPLVPKLFVLAFFAVFFAVTAGTLAYFIVRLVKGIFKLHPVAWTWAVFGGTSAMVLVVDRLPANLRHAGFDGPLLDKHTGALAALLKAYEEGGEMMMALFALMGLLQAYLWLSEGKGE